MNVALGTSGKRDRNDRPRPQRAFTKETLLAGLLTGCGPIVEPPGEGTGTGGASGGTTGRTETASTADTTAGEQCFDLGTALSCMPLVSKMMQPGDSMRFNKGEVSLDDVIFPDGGVPLARLSVRSDDCVPLADELLEEGNGLAVQHPDTTQIFAWPRVVHASGAADVQVADSPACALQCNADGNFVGDMAEGAEEVMDHYSVRLTDATDPARFELRDSGTDELLWVQHLGPGSIKTASFGTEIVDIWVTQITVGTGASVNMASLNCP
ncbi:MAG: hypothetical protein AB1324_03715 [Candidatus Micrarchaeota archaeon]